MRSVCSAAPPVLGVVLAICFHCPQRAEAVPQFARRYNLTCSACHTIAPVLNEQGYMFKRLGLHLPPSLAAGEPAQSVSYLVHNEQSWSLTNTLSFSVTDFDCRAMRTTQEGSSASTTSGFQITTWNAYLGGSIPDTNLFYFGELDIVA